MDSLSGQPSVDELEDGSNVEAQAAVLGGDERRMHVRAYNHWVSLLDGRDFPSIENLDPENIADFAPNSVLLDFSGNAENPATKYVGEAIREECDLPAGIETITDIPSRSLLSRLTDHYMQIIANRAPIGFEAEFVNQRGHMICYRGILMPFSSDGETIDFIYGVINWKDDGEAPAFQEPLKPALPIVPDDDETEEELPVFGEQAGHNPHISWEDGPLADASEDSADAPDAETVDFDPDAGLADRLCMARDSADKLREADARSRAALYRALADAYDFALAASDDPEGYAEILDDAGLKPQARAPMTPIVKLVFGIDYPKARITEFAAALANAARHEIEAGGFKDFIEAANGGLKALVADERAARRPADKKPPAEKSDKARVELRRRQAIQMDQIESDEEFVLVLSRRRIGGGHGYEPIATIDDSSMVDQAIRKATS